MPSPISARAPGARGPDNRQHHHGGRRPVSWEHWLLVGHRLVESVRSVLFAPAYPLVQDLLAAKRDLAVRIASPKTLPNESGCLK